MSNLEKDLEDYRKYIRSLAEARSSETIGNADKRHATVLLTELIRNSKKSLRILCKRMNPDITEKDCYIGAMAEFLDRVDSKVEILMTDYYKKENKECFNTSAIFNLFKNYDENKVKLKYIEEADLDLINSVHINGKLLNFTLSDDNAFRFETDTEKNMGLGCFNDRETVNVLNEKFFALFNLCQNKINL